MSTLKSESFKVAGQEELRYRIKGADERPLSFYSDTAGLFQTTPKIARDQRELPRDEREPLPPTLARNTESAVVETL